MSVIPMTQVTGRAVHVWQRDGNVLLALWKTELLPPFLEPIMNILALGIGLGRFVQDVQGVPYIQFIAPGFICSSIILYLKILISIFLSTFFSLTTYFFSCSSH